MLAQRSSAMQHTLSQILGPVIAAMFIAAWDIFSESAIAKGD